ncbi:MAG TPA: hypothetical protein PK500_02530 [Candidatus Egerieousia sp.]|nr:hypothetical protein [Candidatus Egerieousia sp.]HPT05517.1 hypothetical protein [Candidatus Egerieousia sp.]
MPDDIFITPQKTELSKPAETKRAKSSIDDFALFNLTLSATKQRAANLRIAL